MRIVVLLPKLHAGAELTLNKLLRRKDLNIVGIVRSDISFFRKKYWRYVTYGVRKAGLFYGAAIAIAAYVPVLGMALAGLLIWNRRRQWRPMNELIERYHLKVHDTEDINSLESRKLLKSWKPDVIISVYFDQILKKPVLKIPKVAALNMHPALLPRYRGIWPEFWKLHNREKFAGVTVHRIIEKIDAGDVLAQKKYPIAKVDTKFSLMLKSAKHGATLLIQTLRKMKKGIRLPVIRIVGKPRYYSLPKKLHFDAFYARGKKMFKVWEVWRAFESRY